MGRRTASKFTDPAVVRLNYLLNAAYYYFKAETNEENLGSAFHRKLAESDATTLRNFGIEPPSARDVYQCAKGLWPIGRLHPYRGEETVGPEIDS